MAQERENLKTDEENRLVTRGVLDEIFPEKRKVDEYELGNYSTSDGE